jgi:hypothetical protein
MDDWRYENLKDDVKRLALNGELPEDEIPGLDI